MGRNAFDQKFGAGFASAIPLSPGVYLVFDSEDHLIYVGKAKNLRRRLQQYRNAKRRKRHYKMREIVKRAARIELRECPSELEAELLELSLIQKHRPKMNVAGAFHFLYPLIGYRADSGTLYFGYTYKPETLTGFSLHGAYRSRHFTGEAFFALMALLKIIGHPLKSKRSERKPGTYVFGFRRLPAEWAPHWERFFRGESRELLENMILALVDNAGARKKASEIQEHLDALVRFFRHEAVPLAKARKSTAHSTYPVTQQERDLLFVRYRRRRSEPTCVL